LIILINNLASLAHLAHLPLELSLGSLVYVSDGPDHLGALLDQVSFLRFPVLGHRAALVLCDQLLFGETVTNKVPERLKLLPILGVHSTTTNQWPPCRLLPLIPHIGSDCSCRLVPLIWVELPPLVHFRRLCRLGSRWFIHWKVLLMMF
jgi:hypothetical protein